MDYMQDQYKGMKLEIHPVEKVNITLDAMNFVGEGDMPKRNGHLPASIS